jgi:hypothetical protein
MFLGCIKKVLLYLLLGQDFLPTAFEESPSTCYVVTYDLPHVVLII